MDLRQTLALVLDPGRLLVSQRLTPDPWQRDLLLSRQRCLLINCARQAGKSTTVATLALHQALIQAKALVLLVAPSERQSQELFRKVLSAYQALGRPVPAAKENQGELELASGARILALPGCEGTIRSFSGVSLLIIDEAARVPEELYRAVRPMLAVSQGRLLALSTPFGRRGWFYHEWVGQGPWQRVQVPWQQCPRIAADFIAEEVRALGQAWVDQEYGCCFTALEGLVYPDFPSAWVEAQPLPAGRQVGGIDFGWRNPFAAVWGVLDGDDVLWLGQERYLRQTPLCEHLAALPREVLWYADPAGRTEIEEMRAAGFKVRAGHNSIRPGIAAVTARLRTGRLKVLPGCPNLIAEASLYRYPTASERPVLGEEPIDADNHALAALRYLVSRLGGKGRQCKETGASSQESGAKRESSFWNVDDERLWIPLG